MAVSKQCDSKLIFRWWDSHICHDTEVFGANSPEILHVSCLLCLQFSAFISVKPFLWHGNSDCLPVFLLFLNPVSILPGWTQLPPCFLAFLWCLFPVVLKIGPRCRIVPLLLCCGLLSPFRLFSTWLTPLLAFMTHYCAFCSCPFCSIALSWLPNCWWHKRGGSLHPSFLGWFCLIPVIFLGALNSYFYSCLLSWAWWDIFVN